MPLLVVPLGVDQLADLTLGEWDALIARSKVLFERPNHPLAERLRAAGVETGPFDGEPSADWDEWALVADPDSVRIGTLAADGAEVAAGSATPPDPLSAARGAYVARRAQAAFGSLVLVMARLRGPDGCPWDAQQTHESLQQHLLEEAHEVLETIDNGATGAELEEELGDLLLQVLFHSELAAEEGRFDIAGVAEVIVAKLVRRHPHVFGDVEVADASEVISNWERIKQEEKAPKDDPFAGIPAGLPSLVVASKTFKKAQGLGHSVTAEQAQTRATEALEQGDLGAALLWIVATARERHIDAEGALRRSLAAFRAGFDPGSRQ